MPTTLSVFVLSSIAALGAAQCGTRGNHPNCAQWNANVQFCTSSSFSLATRQAYCPTFCSNLGCTTTTTAAPGAAASNANTNCAKWAANAATPFCVNSMTVAQKTMYCAQTCAFEIAPNADCALYTVTGTAFARGTPSNRTVTPGNAVASGVVTGTTLLSRAFANTGCTIKLFADAAPADTSVAGAEEFVGSAATKFFTVTAANNGALSYTCVCA